MPNRQPCGVLSTFTYCPEHRKRRERARLEAEPWHHLYRDPRWLTARQNVLTRDEHRCTYVVGQRRCAADLLLSVHHNVKVRHLWLSAGRPQRGSPGWNRFVVSACDLRNLRTLCNRHHKLVEVAGEEVSAGKQARSSYRRGVDGGRRPSRRKPRPPDD